MQLLVIGENIHCTRVYKVGGKHVQPDGQGHAVIYHEGGARRSLPVPKVFLDQADWRNGRLKHCAAAAWQGLYGSSAEQAAAVAYLQMLARRQAAAGAAYLDINVDEFSADLEERMRLMAWMVRTVQAAVRLPLSIDSSNLSILRAGLEACDNSRGRPMVNSVSLERRDAIAVAAEYRAVVIASAAGEAALPDSCAKRLENLTRLAELLEAAGLSGGDLYIDPLVFPIATDSNNGRGFLEAVSAVRKRFGSAVHITGGLSNVSFGMPNRRLINQVFARLAVEAGADSGIVDPLQINAGVIAGLDADDEPFRLARALLLGEDAFGVEYIVAHREGRMGNE